MDIMIGFLKKYSNHPIDLFKGHPAKSNSKFPRVLLSDKTVLK